MRIRSLRVRIQLWHGIILALVTAIFGVTIYFQQSTTRMQAIDQELAASVVLLSSELQSAEGDDIRKLGPRISKTVLPPVRGRRPVAHNHHQVYFAVWSSDNELLVHSVQRFERQPPAITLPPSQPSTKAIFRSQGPWREATVSGPADTKLVVGRFIDVDFRDLEQLAWSLTIVGFVLLALGIGGGWFLSQRALQPMQAMTKVAENIGQSDLSGRIDTQQMDTELIGLAGTLNETFSRIEKAFDRQTQFTADASHELRTPLSVMQTHQQLALSRPRTETEYQETLRVCSRAATRMKDLLDSMLTLARLDSKGDIDSPSVNWVRLDLAQIAADSAASMETLADAKQIKIKTVLDPALTKGDPHQLSRLIDNLLTNAIAFSAESSEVLLSTTHEGGHTRLRVQDFGCGIADEHLPHLFDRFYQVDGARGGDEERGNGLGLAICHAIASTHQGKISVQSELGKGTEFEVLLRPAL